MRSSVCGFAPAECGKLRRGKYMSTLSSLLPAPLWQLPGVLWVPAVAFSVALGLAAWGLRALTLGGAIAGVVLTVVLCLAAGPAALIPVFTVFCLTFIATRIGYARKLRNGTAEPRQGRRALQVLANVGISAFCVLPLLFVYHGAWIVTLGACAALTEAAADTVSSEIGQFVGGRAVLITNLRSVAPGTDGGVSTAGTSSGVAAAALVAGSCVFARVISPGWFPLVLMCGIIGMFFDSLLGATLERRGLLNNNAVNYSSTAASAFVAIAWAFLVRIS